MEPNTSQNNQASSSSSDVGSGRASAFLANKNSEMRVNDSVRGRNIVGIGRGSGIINNDSDTSINRNIGRVRGRNRSSSRTGRASRSRGRSRSRNASLSTNDESNFGPISLSDEERELVTEGALNDLGIHYSFIFIVIFDKANIEFIFYC